MWTADVNVLRRCWRLSTIAYSGTSRSMLSAAEEDSKTFRHKFTFGCRVLHTCGTGPACSETSKEGHDQQIMTAPRSIKV